MHSDVRPPLAAILLPGLFALLLAACGDDSREGAAQHGTPADALTPAAPLLSEAAVPDIETFMQIGAAGNPQITPDGSTLFFVSNASGVNQVYRLDLDLRWPYQLTVFPDGVDYFRLSPDGTHLIVGAARGGDENAQMWLVEGRTGAAHALTRAPAVRHDDPVWLPDGRAFVYRSNEPVGENRGDDFHLWRMDLRPIRKTLVAALPGWNVPVDVSPDGRRVVVEHWESNSDTDLHLVDLDTGAATHLTPHEGEATYVDPRFTADGAGLFLISNANAEGIPKRARLDLASGEFLFPDDAEPWEIASLEMSPDRDVLGWTVNEDGYLRLKLWDLAADRAVPAPPLDGLVGDISFTTGSAVAIGFSSAVSTDDVWIWRWTEPELEKLTHSTYAGIDPSRFAAPRLVRYASFDSLLIPAFLYLPPGRTEGEPVPFVIHVHGGPESQFQPAFVRHFQYLLLNGYGILAPNVRGSTGYGREYQKLDNYRNRLDSVRDLKAGAEFLLREGYSRPGLLAVKGASYGGYMTLAAITEYPDLFSAAIDEVGIAHFKTFLERTSGYRRALREAEYGPLSDPEFLESISPLNRAGRIRAPLLVVHGENDPRVPVHEARQIAGAVAARGGAVDTLIFADEGHGVAKRGNILVLYRRMVQFLDAHLKGNPAPAETGGAQ